MTTERDKRNIAYTYWAEGKEEGLVQGREEGKREAFRSMARELSALGVDPAIVEKVVNFTEE